MDEIALSEVSSIYSGFAFKSSDLQKSEGIPIIKIANIHDRNVSSECIDYLPKSLYAQKLDRYTLQKNDILIAMTGAGSVGKVGKMRIVTRQFLVNQRVAIVRINPIRYYPEFAYQVLSNGEYEKFLYQIGLGAGQPNISPSDIGNLIIRNPPLFTQQKIAAILSAYDTLIENNTRRIRILEDMAQAIYREWFVNFRFLGHEVVRMVESGLGPVPEGWEVCVLRSIAEVNSESIKRDNEPDEIGYIDITSVSTGSIDSINWMKYTDAPGRARRIVRNGDTIWSTVRPNRKSYCLILDPEPNTIVSTGFAVIRAKEVPFTFLFHELTTDSFVSYLTNHATGAAYPAVKTDDFENAKIIKPDDETLIKFHEIVEPIYGIKSYLSQKNANLRRARDLLLPKLIRGEIDVSDLNIRIPEAEA